MDQLDTSLNLVELSKSVFDDNKGKLFIGGQEIPEHLRGALRDEADYLFKSRFYELLNATIINEAAAIALIKSENMEHVFSAKQLYHWNHVMKNMMIALAKR